MRNGHVDRGGGTEGGGLRGARVVGRALRGHVTTGNLGGGRERARQARRPLLPGWALNPGLGVGVGERRARASVCLSRVIYGGAAGASAEAAVAASYNCGSPHLLFLFAPWFFSPHTRPWGAGPPAGTSSRLGPVDTSRRLPGRGLRGRRVSQPLAWRPGLAARSPGWRCATLAPTDSQRERARMPGCTETAGDRASGGRVGRRGRRRF